MRKLSFLFMTMVAVFGAGSAPSQPKPGDRTRSPEQMLAEMDDSDRADEEALAEAAKHPLGSVANPVRVGGPEGERAYLARLRCAGGARPSIGPRRSGGVGGFGTIVDLFPLDCGAAAPGRFDVVLDKYHEEHREQSAPPGFGIDPL